MYIYWVEALVIMNIIKIVFKAKVFSYINNSGDA